MSSHVHSSVWEHDSNCEINAPNGDYACRCEVRALLVKLQAWDIMYMENQRKLAEYESRLAALRPLVRGAVECADLDNDDSLARAVCDLTPEQIAWAKGGEQ